MLNKNMWNIFQSTGNIYAYLYVKEYSQYSYNKNEENNPYIKVPLEIKEIKIVT